MVSCHLLLYRNFDATLSTSLEKVDLVSRIPRWNLLSRIYKVDPLVCPKCQGEMRIIVSSSRQFPPRRSRARSCHWSSIRSMKTDA